MNLDQDDKGNAQCAVHIAVTDEQKCSKRFTAATTRIATGDVFTAGPASVPKKGQYAGAAWNENGPGPDPSRKGWRTRRTAALRGKCEVESCGDRFQAGWNQPPCGPHCASKAHSAIKSWQSGPPRKPSVYLRILPRLANFRLTTSYAMGDKLGYLEILRTHHFDLARVERALAIYSL